MLSNKRHTAELTDTCVINICGAVVDSKYQYMSLNVRDTVLPIKSCLGKASEYNVFIGTK